MPIFSGDALGIGVSMDGKYLGMFLRTGRVRVNVQLAEIAAERLVAFHVKRLIAKEQDLMLRQRLVQVLDLAVAERPSERQARDLGANTRRDAHDIDGFVAHRATVVRPFHHRPTITRKNISHFGKPSTAYAAENPIADAAE